MYQERIDPSDVPYLIGENHIKSVLINQYMNKQFSRPEYTCFVFYMNLM